jgi:hypothetical protein
VARTSPKSIQKIIGDYLAREKKEHSKPVSFQVTSEFLCLSYNCAPWWLLAKNSVDDIGCITTYSANNKTALGYTISKPGEDTRLFVIHCSDADQIKDAIVKNFKRPATTNSVSQHIYEVHFIISVQTSPSYICVFRRDKLQSNYVQAEIGFDNISTLIS